MEPGVVCWIKRLTGAGTLLQHRERSAAHPITSAPTTRPVMGVPGGLVHAGKGLTLPA